MRLRSSRLEVEADSDLVSTGVEILALEQSGERHLNARAKILRPTEKKTSYKYPPFLAD